MIYLADLRVDDSFQTGEFTVTRKEIIEFADEFDPQPYHLVTEAAEASIFGGLCASGWQVTALMMRLLTDTFKRKHIAVMGVSAVNYMRWKIPVFAGDSLTARIIVTATSADSNLPDLGSIDCDVQVSNQNTIPVITLTMTVLIAHGPGHHYD